MGITWRRYSGILHYKIRTKLGWSISQKTVIFLKLTLFSIFINVIINRPSLAKAIWATYGRVFVISGLGKLVQDILTLFIFFTCYFFLVSKCWHNKHAGTLFGPIVLNKLISFIEDPEAPISTGLYWSLGINSYYYYYFIIFL